VNAHSGFATTRDEKGIGADLIDDWKCRSDTETAQPAVNADPIVNLVRALAGHNEEWPFLVAT
jgi:hypothetical protein